MATTLAPVREGLKDTSIPTQFKNEPTVDFSNPENARRMRAAIEKVRSELGREYDLVIGGRRVKTDEKIAVAESGQAVGGCRHFIRPQAQPKLSLRCRRR